MQREAGKAAERAYDWALENGIAKEQARAVLPEGLTPSTLYMAGSVRSWIHYVQLRSAPETQREHQEIARACGVLLGGLGIPC
jgi:thymidylate synthase (FAD)